MDAVKLQVLICMSSLHNVLQGHCAWPPTHYGVYVKMRDVQLQPARASASKNRRALQKYTSRCHIMDICRVLLASMHAPRPGDMKYSPVANACTGGTEVVG